MKHRFTKLSTQKQQKNVETPDAGGTADIAGLATLLHDEDSLRGFSAAVVSSK
jgi:hypothetical protein